MKKTIRPPSALFRRLQRAAALHRSQAQFTKRLERQGRRIALRGTKFSFTFSEIEKLAATAKRRAKLAQSDVPDNMLALLAALRALTRVR